MAKRIISLRIKLTATTVLLTFLVVAVFAMLILRFVSEEVEAETKRLASVSTKALDELGTSSSRYLALPAASPMYDNDLAALYSLVRPSIVQETGADVVTAFIVAENGRVWVALADDDISMFRLTADDAEPFYVATADPDAPTLLETLPDSWLARYRDAESLPLREVVNRPLVKGGQEETVELVQYTAAIIDRNGEHLGYLSLAYSQDKLRAEVSRIQADGKARQAGLRRFILLLGIIVLVVGCVIAILQALAITRNIKLLSKATQRIAQGDLSVRADVRSRDEIGLLGQQFNTMADRVQALLLETLEKAKLEKELDIARMIQEALVPPPGLTTLPGFRFAGFFRSASICGGDFWGYHVLAGGDLLLSIGDVTGHGVPSAMISAAAKSGLDTLINVSPSRLSLPYLLEELNKTVYDTAQRKFVMTFLAMKLDTRVGSLEFANAGHNFPLLLRSVNGKPEAQALIARGNRLGDVRNSRYQQIGCELLAGDLIFLYTDGLTEYRDPQGREYTERRLRRLLLSHCHLEPDAILSKVLSDLSEFAGNAPQEDDITIVVVRVGG